MVRVIKTSDNIVIISPEIDFSVTTLKLNASPVTNNSNTEYLTRNNISGNIEKVTSLPTIYNANGTIGANRTVTVSGSNNLSFSNGTGGNFTVSTWNLINLSALTLTLSSISSTTLSSSTVTTVNGGLILNLGNTTTTTNISSATRTLNIDSSTTAINNITIQPGGLSTGEFVFLSKLTKQIRCENIPTSYGTLQILSTGTGPNLTSVTPIDISGVDVITGNNRLYMFQQTLTSGLQYNTALGGGATTFFIKTFRIEYFGYFNATVGQEYSAGILVNGVLNISSVNQFTYSGSTNLPFNTIPVIADLNNGDIVQLALGRNTSNATMRFNGSLVITPIAYY